MAAAASVKITCPAEDCWAELEVPVHLSSSFSEGCRFILRVEPDRTKVDEHLRSKHG